MKGFRCLLLAVFALCAAAPLKAKTLQFNDKHLVFDLPEEVQFTQPPSHGNLLEGDLGPCHFAVKHYSSENLSRTQALEGGDKFLFPGLKKMSQTARETAANKGKDKSNRAHAAYEGDFNGKKVYYETFTFVKKLDVVCVIVSSYSPGNPEAARIGNSFHFGEKYVSRQDVKTGIINALAAVLKLLYILGLLVTVFLGESIYNRLVLHRWKDGRLYLWLFLYLALSAVLIFSIDKSAWRWGVLAYAVLWLSMCMAGAFFPAIGKLQKWFRDVFYGGFKSQFD
ncbi:MAG: hypothetical protein K6F58_02580 [Bacteroidales bacterium]|nr:hypothetical protein [Bacteroidales bacterium]